MKSNCIEFKWSVDVAVSVPLFPSERYSTKSWRCWSHLFVHQIIFHELISIDEWTNISDFWLIKLHEVQMLLSRSLFFLWMFWIMREIYFCRLISKHEEIKRNKNFITHIFRLVKFQKYVICDLEIGRLSESDAFCKPHDIWPFYNVCLCFFSVAFWILFIFFLMAMNI